MDYTDVRRRALGRNDRLVDLYGKLSGLSLNKERDGTSGGSGVSVITAACGRNTILITHRLSSSRKAEKPESSTCEQKSVPHHWDKTEMPETGFKRVTLAETSEEYQTILDHFNQSMSDFNIKSIQRVQNRDLWEVYQYQREVMRRKNSGQENEKLLFHGTSSRCVDAICQQNLDWRICGTHGTSYGKGSYFARDASYSHKYTDHSQNKFMFVCRVLVGEYTQGNSRFVHPPCKNGSDTVFYDSCVNRTDNPTVFVVFEKHQVYPEYLIQYEAGPKSTPAARVLASSADRLSVLNRLSTAPSSPAPNISPAPAVVSLLSTLGTLHRARGERGRIVPISSQRSVGNSLENFKSNGPRITGLLSGRITDLNKP